MIRYSSEVTIARPPHAVYDALLDRDRYSQQGEAAEARRLKELLEAAPDPAAAP